MLAAAPAVGAASAHEERAEATPLTAPATAVAPGAGDAASVTTAAEPGSTAERGADPDSTATIQPSSTPAAEHRPAGRMADTGAGVLPWLAAGGAGALGVGAVAFATARRRVD
ncbi:hypothetical protein RB200_07605 [Streptomyces sp. PmtG]